VRSQETLNVTDKRQCLALDLLCQSLQIAEIRVVSCNVLHNRIKALRGGDQGIFIPSAFLDRLPLNVGIILAPSFDGRAIFSTVFIDFIQTNTKQQDPLGQGVHI